MRLALNLAEKGIGATSPNPMVGAVIVKNGRIAGKGYHKGCGSAHAEVNALGNAAGRTKGSVMYVTLEPCDHFGRTPPCTEAIIRSGIKKVFIAMKDPNPVNNGRGIKRLTKAGIKTEVGLLQGQARRLNRPYIKFITKRLPYVTVKAASSLDGKIATRTGESRWITSEDARRYVHALRARVDAVMVGVNTVIKDDPVLLSRASKAKQPVRVIVGNIRKVPGDAKIFSTAGKSPVYIAYGKHGGKVDLKDLLKKLGRMGIMHVMVEGGGGLIGGLVEERLVDEFLFFIAPKIIGGRDALTSVEGKGIARLTEALSLKNLTIKKFKKDILIQAEAG